jgi:hypothetical protein
MKRAVAKWSLVLLCASMGAAIGGGLYEQIVLMPIWSASPPASFTIIQPETGVPLQRFWIPVHTAITVFVPTALVAAWKDVTVRRLLLVGVASYMVMRVWSRVFFIPEMLAFQQVSPDAPASPELTARVERRTSMTVWREPLDMISFLSFALALFWLRRSDDGGVWS